MPPAKQNLTVYVGDTAEYTLANIVDANENAVDYTSGFTFRAQIRGTRLPSAEVVAEFTVTAPEVGTVSLVLPAEESEKLGELVTVESGDAEAQWDLEVTDSGSGRVFTLLSGRVRVTGDVSREVVAP